MEFKNKREHVAHLIEQGTFTRDQIVEQTETTAKSFGSICSTLRLMGKFPHKKEDGTYCFISKEEYDALEAARGEKSESAILTPEERLERARKAESRAAAKLTNAKAKFEKDGSRENELCLKIAEMELELASIRLSKIETADLEATTQEDSGAEVAPADEPW